MIRIVTSLLCLFAMHLGATELPSYKISKTVMPLERILEGSVEAVSKATVSAQTSGRVDQIMVDVGDVVPAGAVILKLVGVDQKEGLNQAEAAVAETKTQRQAEYQQFVRVKSLYDRKLISKAKYDQAVAAYNSAKARVTSAEASLNRAKQQVSYTEISAAYSGVVSARHVEVGEAVQPGMPLMSGFDPNRLRVYVDLPQAVAAKVRELPIVRIHTQEGQVAEPVSTTFFPVADPRTGTVRMRVELPSSLEGVYPGQLVKVAVQIGERARLLVPVSSLVYRSEVAGVYVLQEGKPRLRQVRVGSRFDDQIEVLAGLEVDESLITDPIAASISAANRSIQQGE